MIDKEATGFIKFPDFLFMMASKVFLFFKNSNVVFIEIIFQLDADLEEQDIREAFAIFDNVRKRLLQNFCKIYYELGWEWKYFEVRVKACDDEHGRENNGRGV